MGRISPLNMDGTAVSFRDPDDRGWPTVAMVRAKDEKGDWRTKRFPITSWSRTGTPRIPDEAKDWAKSTRHDFIKGTDVAGQATIQDFLNAVAEKVTSRGAKEQRSKLIKAVSASLLATSITDMRALGFVSSVRRWLDGLKTGWSMKPDLALPERTLGH